MKPPVLVLQAPGTNRDRDVAAALDRCGAQPRLLSLQALLAAPEALDGCAMLVLPGGFSAGDALGAGRVLGLSLRRIAPTLSAFIDSGRPVLGICNGFQALIAAGLLHPGPGVWCAEPPVALGRNASGRFVCEWVELLPDPRSPCVFTRELEGPIHCPVAHGEGRFVATPPAMQALLVQHQIPLRYVDDGVFRDPNGSEGGVAGLCSPGGTVFGLMPHPENHVLDEQFPSGLAKGVRTPAVIPSRSNSWRPDPRRVPSGRLLLEQGVRYAATVWP